MLFINIYDRIYREKDVHTKGMSCLHLSRESFYPFCPQNNRSRLTCIAIQSVTATSITH